MELQCRSTLLLPIPPPRIMLLLPGDHCRARRHPLTSYAPFLLSFIEA